MNKKDRITKLEPRNNIQKESKLKTGYSPYDMCNEAIRLIESCTDIQMDTRDELQIILLLNKSDSFSNMSKYQLSIARKKFADLYYKNGITGNALEQYRIALDLNPKLSVKKRVAELNKIPKSDLIFSLDANISNEPDYKHLEYHTIRLDDDYIRKREEQKKELSSNLGIPIKELDDFIEETRTKRQQEVLKENDIYDPDFEFEIEERLSKLDKLSRSEFYRIRQERKEDDVLTNKELDIMTLESMERSFFHKKRKSTRINLCKDCLHTKWGDYEMPEPYKPKVSYGPRTDARLIKNNKKGT